MINLYPEKCNLCGGQVIYTSNAIIYGREYGSGKCYYCTNCHAYVGTHVPRPKESLGILADANMRNQKIKCHAIFDELWKHEDTGKKRHKKRVEAYKWLAEQMNIDVSDCHFGYFSLDQLNEAYDILKEVKYSNGRSLL